MRKITFLASIVLLGVIGFLPIMAHAADGTTGYAVTNAASSFGVGIIDDIGSRFQTAIKPWGDTFLHYGKVLFWALVPISLVWSMGRRVFEHGNSGLEPIGDFIKFSITMGFYYWLLNNGFKIGDAILHSLESMAGTAGGVHASLRPGQILQVGFDILNKSIDSALESSWHQIPEKIVYLASGFICLLVSGLISINMLICLVSAWVLLYAGVLILGFGATSWTSDMAIGYFRSVLSASLRIAGMILVIGIGSNVMSQYVNTFKQNAATLHDSAVMILITIVMYLLSNKVPDMLAGLAHGNASHSGGISGGQAIAGLAAATATMAGATKMLAAAATGGVSSGIGAVQAALSASRESNEDAAANNLINALSGSGSEAGSGYDPAAGSAADAATDTAAGASAGAAADPAADATTSSGAGTADPAASTSKPKSTAGHLWAGTKEVARQKMEAANKRIEEGTLGGRVKAATESQARMARAEKMENHFSQQALAAGHSPDIAEQAGLAGSSIIRSGGSVDDAQKAVSKILSEAARPDIPMQEEPTMQDSMSGEKEASA